jgi:hypothetical protein
MPEMFFSHARGAINIRRTAFSASFPTLPTPTAKILVPYHKTTPSSCMMLQHIQKQPEDAANDPPPHNDSNLLGFQARLSHAKALHLELRSPAHHHVGEKTLKPPTLWSLQKARWMKSSKRKRNNSNTHPLLGQDSNACVSRAIGGYSAPKRPNQLPA